MVLRKYQYHRNDMSDGTGEINMFLRFTEAAFIIARPVKVEPVKAILSIPSCDAIAAPQVYRA